MARTACALTLGFVLTACGGGVVSEVGPAASGPGGPAASTSPCRPPLAEDDPHPLSQATEAHRIFGGPDREADLWVEPVQRALQERFAERSGGLWADHAAGEVVVMLTPPEPGADGLAGSDEHAILETLRDGSPHPEAIVCMQAAYTRAELLDLTDRAIRLLDGPRSGGPDTIRNRAHIEVETNPAQAREAVGELADHPALELSVPECAGVLPPPEGAVSLRGTGSNCGGMLALGSGTLNGDPEAGCVWLGDGHDRVLLAWPQGWTIASDGTIHDHRAEARAALGDEVEVGGGHVGGAGDEACATGDGSDVFLVNGLTVVEPAG